MKLVAVAEFICCMLQLVASAEEAMKDKDEIAVEEDKELFNKNDPWKRAKSCNGLSSHDWSCCRPMHQCGVGEGDCDSDRDCKGSLKCGKDNCVSGRKFTKMSDCCYDPKPNTKSAPKKSVPKKSATKKIPANKPTKSCNGLSSHDWSCCSASNQCGVGEGDCDSDRDCKGILKCGKDNCARGRKFTKMSDCCYNPKPSVSCSRANPCGHNGWCNGGVCKCPRGVTGPMCETKVKDFYMSCSSNPCQRYNGANSKCYDVECDQGGSSCIKCVTETEEEIKDKDEITVEEEKELLNKHDPWKPAKSCNGLSSHDWSCCRASHQCGIGEGDCDSDSDCKGSLKCGKDNCVSGRKFTKISDCCYDPKLNAASAQKTVTTNKPDIGLTKPWTFNCWRACNGGGRCSVCGQQAACCRRGWGDPAECRTSQGCLGYHCCTKIKVPKVLVC